MNNKNKSALLPKLRFPDFKSAGPWTTEKLGSVATISTQKVGYNVCVPMSITSGVGLVSQEEKFGRVIAGDSYKNYLLLKPNEFAYNKSATKEYPEGFLTLYSGTKLAAVPNSIFTCFRINGESPDVRFLNYQFSDNLHGRWLRKFIQVGARAHGSLSINDSDLMALPVPTPTGATAVAEQQKIADCLSSLDELIAAQARKVDALKAHKKGLMQQLFPREGETEPRLRFPEFRDAGEWTTSSLGKLLIGSPDYGVNAAAVPFSAELPKYLRITDISEDGRYAHDKQVSVDLDATDENYLEQGDIVLARTGASVGKSYQYREEDGRLVFAGFLIRVKPNPSKLISTFLANFLTTDQFWKWVAVTSARSGQPGINSTEYSSLSIPLPQKLTEQQRISDCLTYLDTHITTATQKLETLETHKKGLMQQLFPSAEALGA
jgi:type I restriction enzyme S subunit